MERLNSYFAEERIDLTALGVSLDSWWVGEDLSKQLAELGFDKQVFAAKTIHVLKVGKAQKNLGEWREQSEVEDGWGRPRAGSRLKGEHPTLGKVAVIFFRHPRSKSFAVICPARPREVL